MHLCLTKSRDSRIKETVWPEITLLSRDTQRDYYPTCSIMMSKMAGVKARILNVYAIIGGGRGGEGEEEEKKSAAVVIVIVVLVVK